MRSQSAPPAEQMWTLSSVGHMTAAAHVQLVSFVFDPTPAVINLLITALMSVVVSVAQPSSHSASAACWALSAQQGIIAGALASLLKPCTSSKVFSMHVQVLAVQQAAMGQSGPGCSRPHFLQAAGLPRAARCVQAGVQDLALSSATVQRRTKAPHSGCGMRGLALVQQLAICTARTSNVGGF